MNKLRSLQLGIFLVGIVPRIGVAILISVLLWLSYFWATATPGGL